MNRLKQLTFPWGLLIDWEQIGTGTGQFFCELKWDKKYSTLWLIGAVKEYNRAIAIRPLLLSRNGYPNSPLFIVIDGLLCICIQSKQRAVSVERGRERQEDGCPHDYSGLYESTLFINHYYFCLALANRSTDLFL